MRARHLLIALLGLLPALSCAQLSYGEDFHRLVDQAYAAYENEEFDRTGNLLDSALQLKGGIYPDTDYYWDAFMAWARAGATDKALSYLEIFAEKGWLDTTEGRKSLQRIETDSNLVHIAQHPDYDNIQLIVAKRDQQYGEIVRELALVRDKDQALRQLTTCAEDQFAGDSARLAYFQDLMAREDQANVDYINALVERHGWLGVNRIGEKANKTLWLIIQHADLETQERYLPMVKVSMERGETPASSYAFLVDRVRLRRSDTQIYGTQMVKHPESGKLLLHPIEEVERVNERRAAIGFEPIEEYVRFFGIEDLDIRNPDFFHSASENTNNR